MGGGLNFVGARPPAVNGQTPQEAGLPLLHTFDNTSIHQLTPVIDTLQGNGWYVGADLYLCGLNLYSLNGVNAGSLNCPAGSSMVLSLGTPTTPSQEDPCTVFFDERHFSFGEGSSFLNEEFESCNGGSCFTIEIASEIVPMVTVSNISTRSALSGNAIVKGIITDRSGGDFSSSDNLSITVRMPDTTVGTGNFTSAGGNLTLTDAGVALFNSCPSV